MPLRFSASLFVAVLVATWGAAALGQSALAPYPSEACSAAELTRGIPIPKSKPQPPDYSADICIVSRDRNAGSLALPQDSVVILGSQIFVTIKANKSGIFSVWYEDEKSNSRQEVFRKTIAEQDLNRWVPSLPLEFDAPAASATVTLRYETANATRETSYSIAIIDPAASVSREGAPQSALETALLSLPRLTGTSNAGHAPPTDLRGSGTNIFQSNAPMVVWIKTSSGTGSGSVLNTEGEILTNQHVVGREKQVEVYFYGEGAASCEGLKSHIADVVKVDYQRDLALVRLRSLPDNIKTISLGDVGAVKVGDDVHVIGSPLDECWSYARGYVSQIRPGYTWRDRKADVIQTQAPISPGNSGGPLLSEEGALIGVNAFQATAGQNLNYAISVREVADFLASPVTGTCDPWESETWKEQDKCIGRPKDQAIAAKDLSFKTDSVTQDTDQNGTPERLVRWVETGNGRRQLLALEDTNQDGTWDRIGYDTDGDGRFDYWIKI